MTMNAARVAKFVHILLCRTAKEFPSSQGVIIYLANQVTEISNQQRRIPNV